MSEKANRIGARIREELISETRHEQRHVHRSTSMAPKSSSRCVSRVSWMRS